VLELLVSQDGGVSFLRKSWDGKASDHEVFKARSAALIQQCKASEAPRYLIADSKLSTEEHAHNLARLPFLTWIPRTLQVENQVIAQAWRFGHWQPVDETRCYQRIELCHYGIAQRWLVVYSASAWQRAAATLAKAQPTEQEKGHKQLFPLHVHRFPSLFVTKPSRLQGLLMVMTLALSIHSVAQRRLRIQLQAQGETLPNQIHQPTAHPTLRWIFQRLAGIHRVVLAFQGQGQVIIAGLTDLRRKILQLFKQKVCQIYQISSA
jgi:transposase